MVAPDVAELIVTVWRLVYVPEPGENVGVATVGVVEPAVEVKVHVRIFWLAESEPVPPVNPTYAVFPPTMEGILTVQLVE